MGSRVLPGINIQWPISEMILSGKKTIETRTYPLPPKYLNQEMVLIETPGKKGKFTARIKAVIKFTECFLYKSKSDFYLDQDRHHVTPESDWAWESKKPKWGWEVEVVKKFDRAQEPPISRGIIFTKKCSITPLP